MADQMVLKTQQWLNSTYGNKTGFGSVQETGNTGWDTINALIRALQIELGITATANNFGLEHSLDSSLVGQTALLKLLATTMFMGLFKEPCGARDIEPNTVASLLSLPTTWPTLFAR